MFGDSTNQVYERYGASIIRVDSLQDFFLLKQVLGDSINESRNEFFLSLEYPIYLGVDTSTFFSWMPDEYEDEWSGQMMPGKDYYLEHCEEGYQYIGDVTSTLSLLGVPCVKPVQNVDVTIL